jgi:hypothetical protein
MTELLKSHIERFTLLNNPELDTDRFESFYSKCAMLPIAYLEAALKKHKDESKSLECKEIPELMLDEGVAEMTTSEGVKVTCRTELNVSIAKLEDKSDLVRWLKERSFGYIVKEKEYLDAREVTPVLRDALEKGGYHLYSDVEINTNSLKKVLKDHFAKTEELPTDIIPVSLFTHAVIKQKKEEVNE